MGHLHGLGIGGPDGRSEVSITLKDTGVMKKIPVVILAATLIAITVMERKKVRALQERAHRILYPGNPQEMSKILAELRSHQDPESQTLVEQLEERLQRRGHRQRR